MTELKPVPKIASARPTATWLALKLMASTPNRKASTAPASIPAPTPSHRLPVSVDAKKPDTAPHSIMPSTPRLSTPERSVTSSPSAA